MDTSTTRTVTDLPATDRQALEHLLGQPLNESQQVFILAFTPGSAENEAVRIAARERLLGTFAKVEVHAQQQNASATEADAAIAEAMSRIRNRE